MYHYHAKDIEFKMRALQSGDKSLVVSTNAFGVGVDTSDINMIIHIGPPRSSLEYAQKSGPAGRVNIDADYSVIIACDALCHIYSPS